MLPVPVSPTLMNTPSTSPGGRSRSFHVAQIAGLVVLLLCAVADGPVWAQKGPPTLPVRPPQMAPPSGRAVQEPVDDLVPVIQEQDVEVLATFTDARSVGVDPNGICYVTDATRSTVTAVSPDGQVLRTLGGRGSEAGAFDEPLDADPSNGLEIFVADAGNGRVQHFSRSGKYIEALPIGRIDPGNRSSARQPLFDAGRDGSDARADGRPISVSVADNGDVFVLDARDRLVVRFDRQRRPEPFAGGFDARDGQLLDPTHMVFVRDQLLIADAGHGAIMMFDRFGSFDRLLRPIAHPVRALVADGRDLWVVEPRRILVVDPRTGRARGAIPITLDGPIVDAARIETHLVLLTPTRLLVVPRVRLPR